MLCLSRIVVDFALNPVAYGIRLVYESIAIAATIIFGGLKHLPPRLSGYHVFQAVVMNFHHVIATVYTDPEFLSQIELLFLTLIDENINNIMPHNRQFGNIEIGCTRT